MANPIVPPLAKPPAAPAAPAAPAPVAAPVAAVTAPEEVQTTKTADDYGTKSAPPSPVTLQPPPQLDQAKLVAQLAAEGAVASALKVDAPTARSWVASNPTMSEWMTKATADVAAGSTDRTKLETQLVGRLAKERFYDRGLSAQQLMAVMPGLPQDRAERMLPHLNTAMKAADINTPVRAQAFLAQLAHESGELKYFEELASGGAYEGRGDLGNTQAGDGMRFKGRGPIQLTGRYNYSEYGAMLAAEFPADSKGNPNWLVENPELASRPDIGFRLAAAYWEKHGLNGLADAGDFDAITKRINGGYNGAADRNAYYANAKQVLGSLDGGPISLAGDPVPPLEKGPAGGYSGGLGRGGGGVERLARGYAEANNLFADQFLQWLMQLGISDPAVLEALSEKLANDPEFIEFAKKVAPGWAPGKPVPEGAVMEFLASKFGSVAQEKGMNGAYNAMRERYGIGGAKPPSK